MLSGHKVFLTAASVWLAVSSAFAVLSFDNSFYSVRNKERDVRKSTSLIILHTTEAPSGSALRKLSDLGECNFCINEAGRVFRIIDHRREAYHAGRSMWNGRSNVDDFSVGIEICGYHDKPLSAAQYASLAALIGELKAIYKIPDAGVLAHSQVAYGAPNKWQKCSHRGRKRCGMLLATPAVRAKLGLKTRAAYDPDVRARRLADADPFLTQVLYGKPPQSKPVVAASRVPDANVIGVGRGAWEIARDAYDDPTTLYVFPNGTKKRGNQLANFKLLPPGTRVLVNAPADNRAEKVQVVGDNGKAQDIAGDEVLKASTIYVYPDGRYTRGSQLGANGVLKLPYGTKVLLGYEIGGPISASRPAATICGNRWRSQETYFLISGALVPGNKVDDSKIPPGAMLFFKS
jgi:hypothetical protein